MLTQVIWWSTIVLEVGILLRLAGENLYRKFPIFYFYLGYVLLEEVTRFAVFHWWHGIYPDVYWDSQFLSVLVGCGVIFEIYRVGLREFPGTARMARNLLLFVFAMVFAKALVTRPGAWWSALTAVKLEWDLRIVQSGALLALVVVLLLYAIPLGTNLRGIAIGYGIFLSTSVLELTLMIRLGVGPSALWAYLRSAAYLLVLIVWMIMLWTYQETPKPARAITLDEDYNMLVASTRRRFQKTRLALGKVVRP